MSFSPMYSGLMPGEWDALQEAMRRTGSPLGLPTANPAAAMRGGILGTLDERLKPFGGLLGVGANLLSQSGQTGSFGGALGNALLQGQQRVSESEQDKLRSEFMQAQIEAMRNPRRTGTPQTVIGPDGKPILTSDWEGKQPYMEPQSAGGKIGQYSPGDYTPESWAQFIKSNDPAVLKRYTTPRQDFSPSYQNITRLRPDGSLQYGVFNTRTGTYDWSDNVVPAGTKPRTDAAGRVVGEATGKAVVDLPNIETSANYTTDLVKTLKTHPGKKYAVGAASVLPTIPGTPQADFVARLEQVRGKQFLEAFNGLRGGGAITEIEGQKAEAAIARMQRSQTAKEFDAAADEFVGIINAGLQNARKRANQGGAAPAAPGGGQYSEGQTATNPRTGEKMIYSGGRWVKQ